MVIGVILGTIVGAIAGFVGSIVDNVLMRLVDVMLSLPTLFVILVAASFLGRGTVFIDHRHLRPAVAGWASAGSSAASSCPSGNESSSRRHSPSACATGGSSSATSCPNAFSPIVVVASLLIAGNIIAEAFVSFLGFGVDPTTPSWGNILSGGLQFITQGNWWWPLFPGLAIIVTVLAVNFVGDGLRDAFDPRSRA